MFLEVREQSVKDRKTKKMTERNEHNIDKIINHCNKIIINNIPQFTFTATDYNQYDQTIAMNALFGDITVKLEIIGDTRDKLTEAMGLVPRSKKNIENLRYESRDKESSRVRTRSRTRSRTKSRTRSRTPPRRAKLPDHQTFKNYRNRDICRNEDRPCPRNPNLIDRRRRHSTSISESRSSNSKRSWLKTENQRESRPRLERSLEAPKRKFSKPAKPCESLNFSEIASTHVVIDDEKLDKSEYVKFKFQKERDSQKHAEKRYPDKRSKDKQRQHKQGHYDFLEGHKIDRITCTFQSYQGEPCLKSKYVSHDHYNYKGDIIHQFIPRYTSKKEFEQSFKDASVVRYKRDTRYRTPSPESPKTPRPLPKRDMSKNFRMGPRSRTRARSRSRSRSRSPIRQRSSSRRTGPKNYSKFRRSRTRSTSTASSGSASVSSKLSKSPETRNLSGRLGKINKPETQKMRPKLESTFSRSRSITTSSESDNDGQFSKSFSKSPSPPSPYIKRQRSVSTNSGSSSGVESPSKLMTEVKINSVEVEKRMEMKGEFDDFD